MSPEQRALARQALGLPNPQGVSFKNFVGTFRSERARRAELDDLTRKRLARPILAGSNTEFFALTRAGAERVLEPGERLDPAHFPPIGQD